MTQNFNQTFILGDNILEDVFFLDTFFQLDFAGDIRKEIHPIAVGIDDFGFNILFFIVFAEDIADKFFPGFLFLPQVDGAGIFAALGPQYFIT